MEHTVNQRIKILRESLKLSPAKLASLLKCAPSSITRLESGENSPRENTLNKIASVCNANKEWLHFEKGEMFKNGSLEENIELVQSASISADSGVNPWENALIKELKEEVSYLRELLRMSIGGKGANANFKKASEAAKVPLYLLNEGIYSGAIADC